MKKLIFSLTLLFAATLTASSQAADQLVSQCVMNIGPDAKFLKDFRVQLGKADNQQEFRYKAKMSLWKNTRYRFSMCNAQNSSGRLILTIKDQNDKVVLSSFDSKSGRVYPFVDFTCNKSGIYQISYDFVNWQQGSGVGVVSMIK